MLILTWVVLSFAVGMFAEVRRYRSFGLWLFISLIFSPIIGGIFIAILKEPVSEIRLSR